MKGDSSSECLPACVGGRCGGCLFTALPSQRAGTSQCSLTLLRNQSESSSGLIFVVVVSLNL